VDASGVTYCDSSGAALFYELQKRQNAKIAGLPKDAESLLKPYSDADFPKLGGTKEKHESAPVSIGRVAAGLSQDVYEQMVFTGQAAVALVRGLANPRLVRWGDMWRTVETAGVNAIVIVGLIGFLTGMIMAFQSTVPLQQFGVDIFVVNLVALAMLRELGGIMTAIVLAGRSGSAFAAEIGTMKVNEEVDALTTMGLDPVRFLVVPKLMAAIIVTPLLTVYANVIGIAGGLMVVMMFGHPWASVYNQLVSSVELKDVATGMIKSVFFGALVGGIGCLRGLQTKSGASAVGESTTRAVVSGIFLIIAVDAIFAVVFYAVGF
jgi:phospholipid/cholesterol/gamma-HCH transport system permease protein